MRPNDDRLVGWSVGRASLLLALLLLGGCLIRVTHEVGGMVTTDMGEECSFGCSFQVEAGEDFLRTFTATPDPGIQFIRWNDSMGNAISACPSPTLPVCRIEINSLNPLFKKLSVEVVADFGTFNGFDINLVYFSTPAGVPGTYAQLTLDDWRETYSTGQVFDYKLVNRLADRIVLEDSTTSRVITINLGTGSIHLLVGKESESNTGAVVAGVVSSTGRPSGWMLETLAYGGASGVYLGDFLYQGEGKWVDRDPRGKRKDIVLEELERDDTSVVLEDLNGRQLRLNLAAGAVQLEAGGPPGDIAYIHNATVPVSGWSVIEVEYAELGSAQATGFFRRTGGTTWEQIDAETGQLIALYSEQQRMRNFVDIVGSTTSNAFRMDVIAGVISVGPYFDGAPVPKWDILSAH